MVQIPTWVRELKDREKPPMVMRAFLRMYEDWHNPRGRFATPRLIEEVKASRSFDDIDAWIDLAMHGLDQLLVPIQNHGEIRQLMQRLQERRPRTCLEVGTLAGGTLFLLSRVIANDACVVSVDLPYRGPGMGYPRWKDPLLTSFAWPSQKMHLLRGSSRTKEMIEQVESLGQPHGYEFMLIDGDHSYEGVKSDWMAYRELAASGGMVAFHDIADNESRPCGVPRFWNEIKHDFVHEELVESPGRGCGIGILYL